VNMTEYTPNFDDKRVKARIKQALGFSLGVLSPTKSHQWSTRYIDKFFGSQRNELSKYLRSKLLITTCETFMFGSKSKCKEYILNESGVRYLKERLNLFERSENTEKNTTQQYIPYCSGSQDINTELVKDAYKSKFNKELTQLDFTYNDKSSRYWHPLQNVRSDYRREILSDAGLQFQYDIQSCAPTLLLRHAQQLVDVFDSNGKWKAGPMDLWLHAYQSYLKNRKGVRKMIARDLDIPEDTAKRIINALFAGAQIAPNNPDTDINKLLIGDKARIMCLAQHHYIIALRRDIKIVWEYIEKTLPQVYSNKSGKPRKIALSSKRKWGVYFDLERRVINSVRDYLTESGNKCFLEHDGWTCKNELDITEVERHVLETTGLKIKLERTND